MRIRLADLWSWQGTIDRGPYLLIGLLGFALKHNLDRLIATHLFGRRWDIFNYWLPPTEAARLASLPAEEQRFFAALLLLALPFIWVGVVLTTRRLRAAGLPLWLVVVFFLPVINLAFFLSLALLPSRPSKGDAGRKTRGRVGALFDRWIPRSAVGSAAMSLLLTLPFGILFTRFGTATLNQYGWGLFVGLPFALGFAAVLLYGYHQPRSYAGCLLVSWFSVLFTALGIFALAVEGLICIVMAAPMAVVLAAIGGSLGYLIQSRPWSHAETPSALLLMVFFVPSLMGMEAVSPPERPLFAVRTAIEIDAPREAVWRRVVAFTQLPSPTDWFFRLGIAYPIRAEIHGTGVGAERYCLFSTGPPGLSSSPSKCGTSPAFSASRWSPIRRRCRSGHSTPSSIHPIWMTSSFHVGASFFSPRCRTAAPAWRALPGITTTCGRPATGSFGRTGLFTVYTCAFSDTSGAWSSTTSTGRHVDLTVAGA
jgi:uncharacterized membrane protein YhaH (DUF805 family)